MQLRRYLKANDISVSAFAAAIGVGDAAVYKYLSGERYPSRRRLERIAQVTGGQVLPNDFYGLTAFPPRADEQRA